MKQLRKILALLMALATVFALCACANEKQDNSAAEKAYDPVDPDKPYLLMVTDIQNGAVAVVDLDLEDPMKPENYYWYWTADPAKGWKYGDKLLRNLSDARLRWSENYNSYVVLMTAASGWLGIAEYPSGKCLWETANTLSGPHAMELLPSGDLVVASSGGTSWETEGRLAYYHTTDGKDYTLTSQILLPSAHGVLWDPENETLWATSYTHLMCYDILPGEDGIPTFYERADGPGALLVSGNGHDLMTDHSDPNMLWISCDKAVVKYDKAQDKILSSQYTYSDKVAGKYRVKGVTSFKDGTVVYSKCGDTSSDWLDVFYVLWPLDLEGKDAVEVEYQAQDGSYWNKVRVFDPNY